MFTNKQKKFVTEYLICLNATEAARRAGYRGSDNTLAAIGSQNLKKPKIAEQIQKVLAARAMSADEVIDRITALARANIADFLNSDLTVNPKAVKAHGRLVKSVRHTKDGDIIIELHDTAKNLALLGKYHKLFTERIQVDIPQPENFTVAEYQTAIQSIAEWEHARFNQKQR